MDALNNAPNPAPTPDVAPDVAPLPVVEPVAAPATPEAPVAAIELPFATDNLAAVVGDAPSSPPSALSPANHQTAAATETAPAPAPIPEQIVPPSAPSAPPTPHAEVPPVVAEAPVAPPQVAPPQVALVPEAPIAEPPRALVPGAFLKLEYEVKQVLARGMTNLYVADAGGYGTSELKLIAERETPAIAATPAPSAPQTEPTVGPSSIGDDIELTSGALQIEAQVENVVEPTVPLPVVALPDTELMSASSLQIGLVEIPDTPAAASEAATPESNPSPSQLFPPREEFAQDGRDYLVFDYFASHSLQDYREPTNDARYLTLLQTLCDAMTDLETRGLTADFSRDLLRIDDSGMPHYVGFTQGKGQQIVPAVSDAMAQLREINSFLLKRVLAESSTMRLDDQFGSLALSEEVKDLAARLDEGALSLAQVRAEIARLGGGKSPKAEAALLSDVGQEREVNEDSGMIARLHRAAHLGSYQYDLYVVADGMGGHEGGEVASDLTIAALQRALAAHSDLDWNDNVAVKAAVLDVIGDVNDEVVALTQTPKYMAMRAKPGSTLTFAIRLGARLFVGNVGDSRAYKWNASGGLTRISKDHSYVQTLIDAGQLSEEDSWDHPDGSIITAHIGDAKGKTRDVFLRLMAPGDKLLLVSDGVVDMLRDREIAPYLEDDDPQSIVKNLVDASNAAGGLDNITALCVKFE